MNILFLSLSAFRSIADRGIYSDLLRKFRDEGHDVSIVLPTQRREGMATHVSTDAGVTILRVKTLNITKTNLLEKGLATLAIEQQYLQAIKKHLPGKRFDLVLYSTPPITFVKVIAGWRAKLPAAQRYISAKCRGYGHDKAGEHHAQGFCEEGEEALSRVG